MPEERVAYSGQELTFVSDHVDAGNQTWVFSKDLKCSQSLNQLSSPGTLLVLNTAHVTFFGPGYIKKISKWQITS